MIRTSLLGGFIVAVLTLGGCGLDRPYPDKSYYALEAAANDAPRSTNGSGAIRVPRATVAPPFSSRAIQYRVAASRYEPSYYHNWVDDPGALVAAAARETLAGAGALVFGPGSAAAGGATLELYVSRLAVDVTGSQATAMVAVRATLLDAHGTVLLAREFEQSEPAANADAADAVRALNAALQRLLDQLVQEVTAARVAG